MDCIKEKTLLNTQKYLIEIKLTEILLRKRKFNNLNKSESQESFESQKDSKKGKAERNFGERKSKRI